MPKTYLVCIYTSPIAAYRIANRLDNATVTESLGVWRGTAEDSAILSIVTPAIGIDSLVDLARDIAGDVGESTLLVTLAEVSASLVDIQSGARDVVAPMAINPRALIPNPA